MVDNAKIKLYISGPITGIPDYEKPFKAARKKLLDAGFEVEDPTTYGFDDTVSWELAMRYDIAQMVKCDGVATLDDWELSRGANVEVKLARDLGMPVMGVDKWIAKWESLDVFFKLHL